MINFEIICLETKGLTESIKIIQKIKELLENALNSVGEMIKNKIKYILKNNLDTQLILKIADVLDEKEISKDRLSVELTADDYVHFKFTFVTLVNVEKFVDR